MENWGFNHWSRVDNKMQAKDITLTLVASTEEANLFLLHGQQGAGRWGLESVKKKDLLGLPIRVIL